MLFLGIVCVILIAWALYAKYKEWRAPIDMQKEKIDFLKQPWFLIVRHLSMRAAF